MHPRLPAVFLKPHLAAGLLIACLFSPAPLPAEPVPTQPATGKKPDQIEGQQSIRLFVFEGSNLPDSSQRRVKKALSMLPGFESQMFRENSRGPFYQLAVGYRSRVDEGRLMQTCKSVGVVPPALRIVFTRDVTLTRRPEIGKSDQVRKVLELDPQVALAPAIQVRDQELAARLERHNHAKFAKTWAIAERSRQQRQRLETARAEGQKALRRATQSIVDRGIMERLGGTWTGTSGLAVFINQLETDDFDGKFGSEVGRWSLRDDQLCFQRKGSSAVTKYQYDLADDGKALTLRPLENNGPKPRNAAITLMRR